MKVRIIKEEHGLRTYFVESGDRRHPALAVRSHVLPGERAEVRRTLIADVTSRAFPEGARWDQAALTLGR